MVSLAYLAYERIAGACLVGKGRGQAMRGNTGKYVISLIQVRCCANVAAKERRGYRKQGIEVAALLRRLGRQIGMSLVFGLRFVVEV